MPQSNTVETFRANQEKAMFALIRGELAAVSTYHDDGEDISNEMAKIQAQLLMVSILTGKRYTIQNWDIIGAD